nr:mating type protein MAT1-1-1 [Diaporthe caulivora]
MQASSKLILGGRAASQAIVNKQRRVKDGRVEKKPLAGSKVANSQEQQAKKGVNGYMMFRSIMQQMFNSYTQRQRSDFIREMWAKEPHKSTWTLIAKVWTHIRDNSGGYNDIVQFCAGAIMETGLTPPDRWFLVHNFQLVRDNMGTITARQQRAPTSLLEPRQFTDVELLFHVLKRGLPVKDPVQLLDSLVRSQKHYMAFCDPTAPTGKLETTLFNAMDDPLTTAPYLFGVQSTDSLIQSGFFHLDSFEGFHIDDGQANENTIGGFQFDNGTAHVAVPNNSALDTNIMPGLPQSLDMEVPDNWNNFSGQISQQAHQTATNTSAQPTDDYPYINDFEVDNVVWNLQPTA